MRVMLDTNVLVMSAIFSSAYISRMLDLIAEHRGTGLLCFRNISKVTIITPSYLT